MSFKSIRLYQVFLFIFLCLVILLQFYFFCRYLFFLNQVKSIIMKLAMTKRVVVNLELQYRLIKLIFLKKTTMNLSIILRS